METAPPPVSVPAAAPVLAGRWRRIFALLIDLLVLTVPSYAVGFWIGERIAPAGGPGRLFGLVIALPYFGLLESRLGGGRTLGKRLAGIRVVGAGGQPLPPGRTFARAMVFLVPFFLNGVGYRGLSTFGVALTLQGILVFGLGSAILLTLLFNRRTRQGTHDLLVGSFVVRDESAGVPVVAHAALWPAILSVVCLGCAALAAPVITALGPNAQVQVPPAVTQLLAETPGIQTWSISHRVFTIMPSGGSPVTRQRVDISLAYSGVGETGAVVLPIVRALLKDDPRSAAADSLRVVVVRGWDLGLASWKHWIWDNRPPQQWPSLEAFPGPGH